MFIPTLKSKADEDISLLLQLDNHSFNYICDCGDASELTVKDCINTRAIFISHTHIDHFINFDFILRHQLGMGEKVTICGPKGITAQVQAKIRGYSWNLVEADAIVYEVREIVIGQQIQVSELAPPLWEIRPKEVIESAIIYKNDRFQVSFIALDHKLPSIAYLFKEKNTVKIDIEKSPWRGGKWVSLLKKAYEEGQAATKIEIEKEQYIAKDLFHLLSIKAGATLGVIMDHAANAENQAKIKSLFANCDQVFIESFYKETDKDFADLNFHSYSTASGALMKDCKVKEAIPVHFSRKYTAAEVAELIVEFESAYQKREL